MPLSKKDQGQEASRCTSRKGTTRGFLFIFSAICCLLLAVVWYPSMFRQQIAAKSSQRINIGRSSSSSPGGNPVTSLLGTDCAPCRQFNSDTGVAIRTIECNTAGGEDHQISQFNNDTGVAIDTIERGTAKWGGRPSNYTECALNDIHGKYVATSVFRKNQFDLYTIMDSIGGLPMGIVLSQKSLSERTLCATPMDGWGEIYVPKPDFACRSDITPRELASNMFQLMQRMHKKRKYPFDFKNGHGNKNRDEACCFSSSANNSVKALDTQALLHTLKETSELVNQFPIQMKWNQFDISYNASDVVGFSIMLNLDVGQHEKRIQQLELARQASMNAYRSIFPGGRGGHPLPAMVLLTQNSSSADGEKLKCQCVPLETTAREMISL